MSTSKAKNANELDLKKALKRMQSHALNTRFLFAQALKIKTPDTLGRLAGPLKHK